jgi:ABC-2 type transport system permease protein
MMSAYVDFIRIRFLTMLAYRVNYYSGIIIYAINIGAYYFLWKAIFGSAETLQGLH